ncbi:MAG: magnesium and cobalt transport protein CorA [Actinomycetia bacterium]|nr:magnesium and cobalt transport protein CorA [Actinomycetes bacterium]
MITVRVYRPTATEPEITSLDAIEFPDSDGLLWVDVEHADATELDAVCKKLGIGDVAAEDLVSGNQRTKLEKFGDQFHVSVHDVELIGTDSRAREIDLMFGKDWLLSVRQQGEDGAPPLPPMPSTDVAKRFERQRAEHKSCDVGLLLWAFLDVVVDKYFDITDGVDDQLDEIEALVFDPRGADDVPRQIFDMRRTLVRFRRVAAPLREVVSELLRHEDEQIGAEALTHFQDVYDHVLRVIDLVESQRDLLNGLLEARLAIISNKMNQVMKATSSWGAILIVASLITGVYGMNFLKIPLLHWEYGFWYAMALLLAVTGGLWLAFKRRGWL